MSDGEGKSHGRDGGHEHDHPHGGHSHDAGNHGGSHGYTHGAIDPSILTSERGIWALKWSFIWLFITAILQAVVVWYTGSVALLADTIHNFSDATTAIPLWIAFAIGLWKPTKRFTYGLGRVEDLAGVFIVLAILISAILAGYESVKRLYAPQDVTYLWAVAAASIVGFIGNEAVAIFRIKVGREIGSAALIADGYHARTDGLTSLAVLFGAIGVWLGFPLADPIVGLIITLMILKIVWDSAKSVFIRLLDGVEPNVVDEISEAAKQTPQVEEVTEVRVRWLGHNLHAELNLAVNPQLTLTQAHEVAVEAQRNLLEKINYLSQATVHVDPTNVSGEAHHHKPQD
ncbi:MAG: cation diffusion facilitator family transporter [Acidobacteriota bacterium]|nr:cation diffusion facilitator family transporter [Acidobacteriota bacterium]